eukprot:1154350-Pelagomonas_calceolata.AAC.8
MATQIQQRIQATCMRGILKRGKSRWPGHSSSNFAAPLLGHPGHSSSNFVAPLQPPSLDTLRERKSGPKWRKPELVISAAIETVCLAVGGQCPDACASVV